MSRNDNAGERLPSIEVDPVTGVVRYARSSPSQIKTHKLCNLKWWLDKRAHKDRKPPSKGQERGTLGHGRIEDYLLTGTDARDQVELAGASMLLPFEQFAPRLHWDRNPGRTWDQESVKAEIERVRKRGPLSVEESIGDVRTPGGVQIIGFADLMLPPGLLMLGAFDVPEHDLQALFDNKGSALGWVIDHKFKKDLDKYADSAFDLQSDPQAIIYAHALRLRWPGAEAVRFVHHNYQTQGRKKALPVGITLTKEEIHAKWSVLSDYIDGQMAEDATKNSDRELKANTDACKAFGGCDFEAICPKSPRNRFLGSIPGVTRPGITIEGKTQMGLVTNTTPPAGAPAPSNAVQPAGGIDVLAMLRNAQGGGAAATPTPAPLQPAPVQTQPVVQAPAVAPGSIFAQFATANALYHVPENGVAKFVGIMGDKAVFMSGNNAMVQVPVATMITPSETQPDAAGAAQAKARRLPIEENGVIVSGPAGMVGTTVGAGSAVNPPDANKPAANVEQKTQIEAATQVAQQAAVGLASPAGQAAIAQVVNVVNNATAPAPETKPEPEAKPAAKRGRPPGKKNKASDVATGAAQAEHLSGLILLVNTAVTGPVDFDGNAYVDDLHDQICKAQTPPVPDVRFADPKGPLGFGAWRGLLAAAARQSAPTGVVVINSGDLADPVIEALTPLATLVVRGSLR